MDLEAFVRPLYQDLDGISRFDEIERVRRIARRLYEPLDGESARNFELLLLFHGLGKWLEKVGNISRTALAVEGLSEGELRRTAASVAGLPNPEGDVEKAVAAAILIDRSGVRGLAQRFASARREGQSVIDVVREAVADAWIPEWMPASGRAWLARRHESRRKFCAAVLEELSLED